MTFRVGQKVVCVDDDGNHYVKLHAIYTISRIWEKTFPRSKCQGVWLAGIKNENDYPFFSTRFRPIVERKTDISFAHKILKKASNKQGADA